ncbi:sodium:calcium antiporter [Cloacibacillus porcorum]
MMIYAVYLIIAASVVWCSIRASEYVDIMEKHTTLSGAFIGGVVLSAVTSLPELFTSLTSTMLLDKPGLAIGNILGSNIFNCAMLAVFIIIYYRSFSSFKISKSHITVTITVAAVYAVLFLNMAGILNIEYFSINIASVVIVALYIYGVFHMSGENGAEPEPSASLGKLSLKEVKRRFALAAVGLVLLSIILTYLTDGIATRHHLGEGLAGALFLGVATSLPEAASTMMLFRLGSYNIAVGNIVGSNLFNFVILGFADITYIGKGVYDYSDPKTLNLLIFGALANLIFLRLIWNRKVRLRWLCPILIIACYLAFLLI